MASMQGLILFFNFSWPNISFFSQQCDCIQLIDDNKTEKQQSISSIIRAGKGNRVHIDEETEFANETKFRMHI